MFNQFLQNLPIDIFQFFYVKTAFTDFVFA